MELLKAMSIKPNEFSNGLILRGLCRLHTTIPYVFEVIHQKKDNKYYLCVMDPQYVGSSLIGDLVENDGICDYEEITDITTKGVFNKVIYFINYYNKQDGLDTQLAYI